MQPMSVSYMVLSLGFQNAPKYLHHAYLEYGMSIYEDAYIPGNDVLTHERDGIVFTH